MNQLKRNPCKVSGCSYPIFGKGYCKKHQYLRQDKSQKKPNRSPINKVSKKESKRRRKYSKIRKEYLEANPICEVKECKSKATEVHHKKGRIGSLLTDKKYFFASCHEHHVVIENNPEWAYKNNYSLSRLS